MGTVQPACVPRGSGRSGAVTPARTKVAALLDADALPAGGPRYFAFSDRIQPTSLGS